MRSDRECQIGFDGIESGCDIRGSDLIGLKDDARTPRPVATKTLLSEQREGMFDGHLADGVLPSQLGDGGEPGSGGKFACPDLPLDGLSDLLVAGRRGHAVSVARRLDIALHQIYGG